MNAGPAIGWADLTDPERDVLTSAGDGPLLGELAGRRERIQPAVVSLAAAGLVVLTTRTTWDGQPDPTEPDAVADVVADDRAWLRSLDAGRYVEVLRTPAGDAALR